MGSCLSAVTAPRSPIVSQSDGGEKEYNERYIEDQVIGEGEFGKVKLCHDMKTNEACAMKELLKGAQFKDNTLYTPVKPSVLLRECNILRLLEGKHYTLKMLQVFETPSSVLLITEYYAGGNLMVWVSNSLPELRTETVSRIAFQLLDALCHCDKHNVIHRDIKPDNIMFCTSYADSELRLIDFGGSIIGEEPYAEDKDGEVLQEFMGSAFYISPEMYQRTYTSKTDVWSLGVTLYVLVAGYPSNALQKTFNILQSPKKANRIKTLPNLPADLPMSFYDLLEDMLQYRHKMRKSCHDLIKEEFVQFHKYSHTELALEDVLESASAATTQPPPSDEIELTNPTSNSNKITQIHELSAPIKGGVSRHTVYLDFLKFERTITTILVTMLSENEINELLTSIQDDILNIHNQSQTEVEVTHDEAEKIQLQIVKISVLLTVLQDNGKTKIVQMIQQLPKSSDFTSYSYHVNLINQFLEHSKRAREIFKASPNLKKSAVSAHGTDIWRISQKKIVKTSNSAHGGTTSFDPLKSTK